MVQDALAQQRYFVALKMTVVAYFSGQFKTIQTLHPVVQTHVAGDGIQSATVHHCVRAEDHTGGVHNVDLTIGKQRTLDIGGRSAQDPVQDGGLAIGQIEFQRLPWGDHQTLPIQHGSVRSRDHRLSILNGDGGRSPDGFRSVRSGREGQCAREQGSQGGIQQVLLHDEVSL